MDGAREYAGKAAAQDELARLTAITTEMHLTQGLAVESFVDLEWWQLAESYRSSVLALEKHIAEKYPEG